MDSENPYPGRVAHWIKLNEQERRPPRWIVADSEAIRRPTPTGESQTFRCAVAVRWRTDLKTGTHDEWLRTTDRSEFWPWVAQHCTTGRRTVLWFHNASYDLRILAAFDELPKLGFELDWCNLDRDVSVATFRSGRGTLVIADTWTWLAKPLETISGMVGIPKPRLPRDDDSDAAWLARCEADVRITRAAVTELLALAEDHHLGNWQPSGAGMGYATWRHKFLHHKVLVHDDRPAIDAEREAMHAGRAEAWWHGKVPGGPFSEFDMHMAYCRIAAECAVPIRLYAHDPKPSKKVHEWARQHWGILARVTVRTETPVVPCHHNGRVIWPVGQFGTVLWQPELDLIRDTGGTYKVHDQWRYDMAPALKEWAQWSMRMCGIKDGTITPVQQTWIKHQSRALIGRLALRTATWAHWGANPYGRTGMSTMIDAETGEQSRMMHVGGRTFAEAGRAESQSSLPQITGYIMSVSRVRLWQAAEAAGLGRVAHVDTDSVIVDAIGARQLDMAASDDLPGHWRRKESWRALEVTGPRHYRTPGRRVIPGVPTGAAEITPGRFTGEVWESLATALESDVTDQVRTFNRTWQPRRFDGRRPWDQAGPARPIRLPEDGTGKDDNGLAVEPGTARDQQLLDMRDMPRPDVHPGQRGAGRDRAHEGNRPLDGGHPPEHAGDRARADGPRQLAGGQGTIGGAPAGHRPRRKGAIIRESVSEK